MENPANQIESLVERVEAYTKSTLELSKLKSVEMFSLVVPEFISRLSILLMLSLFGLVFNIGIALLLGEWLGKSYYGFFIVAAFYLIAGIVLHFFLRRWIKKPFSELIITQALR